MGEEEQLWFGRTSTAHDSCVRHWPTLLLLPFKFPYIRILYVYTPEYMYKCIYVYVLKTAHARTHARTSMFVLWLHSSFNPSCAVNWQLCGCISNMTSSNINIIISKRPWIPDSWGKRTSGLVELIDVFPTVAALAGLPAPDGVDGTDQSALVASPASSGPEAAYHQYGFYFFFNLF